MLYKEFGEIKMNMRFFRCQKKTVKFLIIAGMICFFVLFTALTSEASFLWVLLGGSLGLIILSVKLFQAYKDLEKQMFEEELYNQGGRYFFNYIHSFHLHTALYYTGRAKKLIGENKVSRALEALDCLEELQRGKNFLRAKIIDAVKSRNVTTSVPLDLHGRIDAALVLAGLNYTFRNIKIEKQFYQGPLIIKGVPIEIVLIFRNILCSAAEGFFCFPQKEQKKGRRLYIATDRVNKTASILFSDIKMDMDKAKVGRLAGFLNLGFHPSVSQSDSLQYVINRIRHNNGNIWFYGDRMGCSEIKIQFNLLGA